MITLKNVSKKYGAKSNEVCALNNISFEISSGEIVSVIGKSGSGKTTLLKVIGGIERADTGDIIINNINISNVSKKNMAEIKNKRIGFVYQDYCLIPELTVLENITLPALIGFNKYDSEYLDYLINELFLSDRLSHYPDELSGGQQQRTSIARALINKPDILLCDEPTGNLDTELSEQVISVILKLSKELNQTVLIATHDMDIVKRTDRTITIKDGTLI